MKITDSFRRVTDLFRRLVGALEQRERDLDYLQRRRDDESLRWDHRIGSLENTLSGHTLAGYRFAEPASRSAGVIRVHSGDWIAVEWSARMGRKISLQEALESGVPFTLVHLPEVKDRWTFFQERTGAFRCAGVEEVA
jgi:hypothetical protein